MPLWARQQQSWGNGCHLFPWEGVIGVQGKSDKLRQQIHFIFLFVGALPQPPGSTGLGSSPHIVLSTCITFSLNCSTWTSQPYALVVTTFNKKLIIPKNKWVCWTHRGFGKDESWWCYPRINLIWHFGQRSATTAVLAPACWPRLSFVMT